MSYNAFSSVYDDLTFNVDYEGCADFITSVFRQNGIEDGLVLDAACGTGTLAEKLAARGYDVILADSSPEMLSVASGKNPGALVLCQSMTSIDLYGTVRACVCTLDSVNHLACLPEVDKFFRKVALFTEPGGVFVFDVNTLHKHRDVLSCNTFVYDLKNVYCVWQNTLHEDFAVDVKLDFFVKNGSGYTRSSDSFTERYYSPELIEEIYKKHGFELIGVYGGYDKSEVTDDTQRLVYCLKRG